MPPAAIKNAYPELPEIAFLRTEVTMTHVVAFMKTSTSPLEVKRAGYVMFRNESGNGKKGVNNNYVGLQADGGRVADKWVLLMEGTCVRAENMTGKLRRFVCFKHWHTSIDFLFERVQQRGLFVGGFAKPHANMQINSENDWPLAYKREWVLGDKNGKVTAAEKTNLLSLYAAAKKNLP